MSADLVNITAGTPKAVQIWGFHGKCTVKDVAKAVDSIASKLTGDRNVIHIMSGTHGYCKGKVGAVATREERFADQDRSLAHPSTKDKKAVELRVHDFNTGALQGPDPVTSAMAKLNQDMRALVGNEAAGQVFLLAYCCSAGTETK